LIGGHENNLAVVPFDHRKTKPLMSEHGIAHGFTHGRFDSKFMRVGGYVPLAVTGLIYHA